MNSPLLGTVDLEAGAVRLERTLPADVATVWAALTDPAQLGVWLGVVEDGAPGPGAVFVLRMDVEERAVCTVTRWEPPHELGLRWDYTGEGASLLTVSLVEVDARTRLTLRHERIAVDPVQYGAGWHAHLDALAGHLSGTGPYADGCHGEHFAAAYRQLRPRYGAIASGVAEASDVTAEI